MAVADEACLSEFVGNASDSTPYAIPWRFDDSSWLVVQVLDSAGSLSTLTLGEDYAVGGDGGTETGTITTVLAVPNTSTVIIYRDTPQDQTRNFTYNTKFPSAQIIAGFDKLTMMIQDAFQRVTSMLSRALRVPDGETIDEIPAADTRAGGLLGFDEDGQPLVVDAPLLTDAAALQQAVEDAEAAADRAEAVPEYRKYMPTPIPPIQALMKAMARGYDVAIDGYGDSTMIGSGASTAWLRNLAVYLGTEFPTHRVEYRALDFANIEMDLTVIQAGPSGRRRFYAPVGVGFAMFLPYTDQRISPAGADVLILEAEIAVDSGSLSGGFPTANINLHGYGSASYRANLILSTAGRLSITWRDGGGTFRGASQSTVSVPALVAGTAVRYRALLICDDGTGTKYNLIYQYSTDSGITWTQVGTTINEAAAGSATSIGVEATYSYWIGHYGGAPVAGVSWYYACTSIADSSAGAVVAGTTEPCIPERIDFFRNGSGSTTGLMQLLGSPTLYVDVVASSGWSLTSGLNAGGYIDTNKKTLIRDRAPFFSFLASSYNDYTLARKSWKDKMDALKTIISGQHASDPNWVHVCQFPVPEPGGNYYPLYHNSRGSEIIADASASASSFSIDMQQWAYDYPDGPLSDLLVGGADVHPSTAGYLYWAEGIQYCCQEGRPV
jgi:hypothetical protein